MPSNFNSQCSKPGGRSNWPARISRVAGFQPMAAFARAPPAEVPTRIKCVSAASACGPVSRRPARAWRAVSTNSFMSSAVGLYARGPRSGLNSRAPNARLPMYASRSSGVMSEARTPSRWRYAVTSALP